MKYLLAARVITFFLECQEQPPSNLWVGHLIGFWSGFRIWKASWFNIWNMTAWRSRIRPGVDLIIIFGGVTLRRHTNLLLIFLPFLLLTTGLECFAAATSVPTVIVTFWVFSVSCQQSRCLETPPKHYHFRCLGYIINVNTENFQNIVFFPLVTLPCVLYLCECPNFWKLVSSTYLGIGGDIVWISFTRICCWYDGIVLHKTRALSWSKAKSSVQTRCKLVIFSIRYSLCYYFIFM